MLNALSLIFLVIAIVVFFYHLISQIIDFSKHNIYYNRKRELIYLFVVYGFLLLSTVIVYDSISILNTIFISFLTVLNYYLINLTDKLNKKNNDLTK